MPSSAEIYATAIAKGLRDLRVARHWSQSDLARAIGTSQSRVSAIENGLTSLTAEEFLVVLELFNVGTDRFVGPASDDLEGLQNVLARLGAANLQETLSLPSERLADAASAIREALVAGEPRLLTALGPVLVTQIDGLNLRSIEVGLAAVGLRSRFRWLVDNVLEALRSESGRRLSRARQRRYRRAQLLLERIAEDRSGVPDHEDILDSTIRSQASLAETRDAASEISRRWRVVTDIEPADFANALRTADLDD